MKHKLFPNIPFSLGICFLLVICISCSSPEPLKSPISPLNPASTSPLVANPLPVPPVNAPAPAPGKASISGVMYSFTTLQVIAGTMFYLTRAVGPNNQQMPPIIVGPLENAGDIRGTTNDKGEFSLNNIPPGNYYLIVWAAYDWPEADKSPDDRTPRLISVSADQQQPLGIVYVGWP